MTVARAGFAATSVKPASSSGIQRYMKPVPIPVLWLSGDRLDRLQIPAGAIKICRKVVRS
jgi:hypothetical protein